MKTPIFRSLDFSILMVALLYYLSAEVGFLVAFDDNTLLPFWPPAGIALALVLLYGRKVWPGIAIGSLVITVKNFWFGSIESMQLLMAISAIITIGRVLEPLAGELLLKKTGQTTVPILNYYKCLSICIYNPGNFLYRFGHNNIGIGLVRHYR
jgi:integral membrane sensor domain MASE1